jgi:putative ABC transport system permease protein
MRRDFTTALLPLEQPGMGLAFVGVVAGLVGALALTRMMNSLLFNVNPTDPLTFLSLLALLLFVALTACLAPAARAMHIDPMDALRTQQRQRNARTAYESS